MEDLVVRCKEILEWRRTGLLTDGAVRRLAASLTHIPEHYRLSVAENQTAEDAMKIVAGEKE